jgi:internalin A
VLGGPAAISSGVPASIDYRNELIVLAGREWPAVRDSADPSRLERFEKHFAGTYWAEEARVLREAIQAEVLLKVRNSFHHEGPSSSRTPAKIGRNLAKRPKYYVSYAWNDDLPNGVDREEIVDRLCAAAESHGILILRDKKDMQPGDSISGFMHRLAQGDRVFVILSRKYLRSIYCMTELHQIWLHCQKKPEKFRDRLRIFTLSDAGISTLPERMDHANWWKEEHADFKTLVAQHDPGLLSVKDYAEFRRMGDLVHQVPDILSLIQDTLHPRGFEDLVRHGFYGLAQYDPGDG